MASDSASVKPPPLSGDPGSSSSGPSGDIRVSSKHPVLFHYTSVDAFRSICEGRHLWATHYQDLNDGSELQRFRRVVSEAIVPSIRIVFRNRAQVDSEFARAIQQKGGIDAVVRQEAEMWLDNLHRNTFGESAVKDTFIFSFCTHPQDSYAWHHGLLSQWRAYGNGAPIAMVLDRRQVEDLMKFERDTYKHAINHIGEVHYDDAPGIDGLKADKEISVIFKRLQPMLTEFYRSNGEADFDDLMKPFILGSTLVKHQGFREESEVRIVVSPAPGSESDLYVPQEEPKERKQMRYRRRGNGEVRYIELFGQMKLPLERIIIGPSRAQNLNLQIVSELVAQHYPEVDVSRFISPSKTPLLD
ncbi:MAG: DUF2971 domain-containing protein [Sulfuritalea sp.]|nr:DUF2971 domain-containing protein [Sulfuritalea sp.]